MISWDVASKHIHLAALSGSGPMTPDGCVRFANRFPSLQNQVPFDPKTLTAGLCIEACATKNYDWGGVGNFRCCACFTCLFDEDSFLR